MDEITFNSTGKHLEIILNRADKLNALNFNMYTKLTELLRMAKDDNFHIITIKSSSDNFCAGNDIDDFMSMPTLDENHPVVEFLHELSTCPVPIAALVNGVAVGIGTTILLHCDFVYATQEATLSLPFAKLGLTPEAGSSLLLPSKIGHNRAMELLLLKGGITATRACELGIVNQVLDSHEAGVEILETATARLLAMPYKPVIECKRLLKTNTSEQLTKTINDELVVFSKCLHSDETQNIISKVLSKDK